MSKIKIWEWVFHQHPDNVYIIFHILAFATNSLIGIELLPSICKQGMVLGMFRSSQLCESYNHRVVQESKPS